MLKRTNVVLALLFLCGCFEVKDELTLRPDGSGTVRIQTRTSVPSELMDGMGGMGRMGFGGGLVYPPTSEAEAKQFFPGDAFTVSVNRESGDGDENTMTIEVSFQDVNALLASPYGRAHQLSLNLEANALVLKAVTGLEGAARMAEMKDDEMGFAALPGLADAQKKKDEMRVEFRVTLPNTVTAGNGEQQDKTAAWVVARTNFTDAAAFAEQLSTVCEARCSAEGLAMKPSTPVRLGLVPFAELSPDVATDAGQRIDTNRIAEAAKFVPYGLRVSRSVDLSGEGSGSESGAELIGAVVVPQEFKPQKWGEARLDEAVDARGNDLKPDDASQARYRYRSFSHGLMEEEEEGAAEAAGAGEHRHVVTLTFRPPEWRINEIARIRGAIELRYFSGSQLVKLTNAIPASWIVDQSKMMSGGFGMTDGDKRLVDPKLDEIGLAIEMQMGMAQEAMTMLMLEIDGSQAALLEAQVFDAGGRPWPTFMQDMSEAFGSMGSDDGTTSCSIMVAGRPQPPLSLALLASGSGAAIEVPIRLDQVPVIPK